MTPPAARELEEFERHLSEVTRFLGHRTTVMDVARRSGHDLSEVSWSVLEHLGAHGAMRVSDVAACHGVDVSSVTPRLQAMEAQRLVTRTRAPGDARVWMIEITREGERALASVHGARCEMLRDALRGIEPDTIAAASALLAQIAGRLSPIHEHHAHRSSSPQN